jgi:hypothetical protein
MNEDILSFIWRFQYFETEHLLTEENQALSVIRTGVRNRNAGPDFSNVRVQIDGVEWVGCVEIHVRASDWFTHQHETDKAFESVVLHVVWENDVQVKRADGTLIPTLSLKGIVRRSVLDRYARLLDDQEAIPCAASFDQISDIQKLAMLDRVLLERLDRKAIKVLELYQQNGQNWEETAYQWLGQHFGFKLNDPAFFRLTQLVPWKIIQKHRNSLIQIEALFFGIAGLIPETDSTSDSTTQPADDYIRQLQNEYKYLSVKYGLKSKQLDEHEWRFLRLRPAGFPTVRLAQFAALLNSNANIFTTLTNNDNVNRLVQTFHLQQSDYWTNHFQFGKKSKSKVPAMGKQAANLLIMNAAVPLMVAYSRQRQVPELLDKAIAWLSEIPSENNQITREWERLDLKVKTAADSQALIEWHSHYCSPRKCLECTVGATLLRSS